MVQEEIKVIGVRRVIAQRMADAARTIPHFSYVEEIDVTELESLRTHLKAPHMAAYREQVKNLVDEIFDALAKDVTAAEKAEDEAGVDGLNLLPDPNVFALTQIFLEYSTPDMPVLIERVVDLLSVDLAHDVERGICH